MLYRWPTVVADVGSHRGDGFIKVTCNFQQFPLSDLLLHIIGGYREFE